MIIKAPTLSIFIFMSSLSVSLSLSLEQPRRITLQEKEDQNQTAKLYTKQPSDKRCPLTLDLKLIRPYA